MKALLPPASRHGTTAGAVERLAGERGAGDPPPWPRRLRSVWAAALTALLGLLFGGVTAMTIVLWATDPAYRATNPVVDLAFFALGGVLVTVGFASQIRAHQVAGLQQAVIALTSLLAAGWLGGRVEPLVGALVLLGAAASLAVLHPDRRQLVATGAEVSRPLAVLAAVAAIPAIVYAADMIGRARAAGPSCFLGQCVQGDRLAEGAGLAIAVVLVALLAAFGTPGWWLPAWSAGSAAILLGAASLAFPGEVGALGLPWAVAAMAWGSAFLAAARRFPYRPHALAGVIRKAGDPDDDRDAGTARD